MTNPVNKIYPDRKWTLYWVDKKKNARKAGVDFSLSIEDKVTLTESFPTEGHPANKGYHLGRIDHSRGYTLDNVEWQWYRDNISEGNKRVIKNPTGKNGNH